MNLDSDLGSRCQIRGQIEALMLSMKLQKLIDIFKDRKRKERSKNLEGATE